MLQPVVAEPQERCRALLCFSWDLVGPQAIRVSGAIVAFVVPADDGLQIPGELDAREELDPPDRVHLHHLELVACQRAGLAQDFVGDAHFSQVVEVGAEPERRLGVLVHPEGPGHGHAVSRHALAVAEGVGVGRLDGLAPLAHDREVGGFELGHFAIDMDQLAARVEPPEQAMRGVEKSQRLLVPPHGLVEQGQLARRLRLVQYRARTHRQLDRRP